MNMGLVNLGIILLAMHSHSGFAKVDIKDTTPVPQCDPSLIDRPMSYSEKWGYIPDGIEQEQDRDVAARRVADKSFQKILNDENVKNSSVVRGVGKVEKKMQGEVSIKSDKSVEHKIAFRVQAWQASAKVNYSGWTNAEIRYDSRINKSAVELSEKVWRDKSIVIGNYVDPIQSLSAVGIAWPLK